MPCSTDEECKPQERVVTEPPVAAATRRTMQANRRRDTRPETDLRSMLHHAGLRFRVDLPLAFDRRRRADIVFTRVHLYIFVDGCFWHGCPDHFVMPKTRPDFWAQKIARNRSRDADTDLRLREQGWIVHRVWEHEPTTQAAATIIRIYRALRSVAHVESEP